jgi:hypothetical protein
MDGHIVLLEVPIWQDILVHLLSDVLFLILLALFAVIVHIVTRRHILGFFGVGDSRSIVVYLSTLHVGGKIVDAYGHEHIVGAFDANGIMRSYTGQAVVFSEVENAHRFKELFNQPLPFLGDTPEWLKRLSVADVDVNITNSPASFDQIRADVSFISIGSFGYNTASRLIEANAHYNVKFASDGSSIEVRNLSNSESDPTCAFIQRICDPEANRSMFQVAGLSELGTNGAGRYLVRNWKKLHKKYGNKQNFLLMLKFSDFNPDNPTIVLEH